MFKLKRTYNGFPIVEFEDHYEKGCSIQISSTDYEAVWVGINDAEPKVLASKAPALGLATDETVGWVPYPIPADVSFNTRMYLTREQAGKLAKLLKHYYKTGVLCELK